MEKKEGRDLEYRVLAEYRNVAGWTGNALGILGFFWGISNNYQSLGVRVAGCIVGCFLSMLFSVFTLFVHWPLIHGRIQTLFVAIFIMNMLPALFWLLVFFTSKEYQVSQNKN